MLKCYDTFTGCYVEVKVSEVLEQEIKRSYWRDEQRERRYYKRCIEFSEKIKKDCSFENEVLDKLIKEAEYSLLHQAIKLLSEREKHVIQMVYFENMTLKSTAEVIGISSSYMTRYLRKILRNIQEKYLELSRWEMKNFLLMEHI